MRATPAINGLIKKTSFYLKKYPGAGDSLGILRIFLEHLF